MEISLWEQEFMKAKGRIFKGSENSTSHPSKIILKLQEQKSFLENANKKLLSKLAQSKSKSQCYLKRIKQLEQGLLTQKSTRNAKIKNSARRRTSQDTGEADLKPSPETVHKHFSRRSHHMRRENKALRHNIDRIQ